jgi:DNA polymerase (family 10)
VVASVHTARNQPSEQLTARTLAAIENPHVDVIAHPTGRIVNRRDPMPLDWPRIFEAAARTGTMLEMNGSPRLDMDDVLGRAATEAGCRVTLASDAHRTEELSQLDYAVSMARRGWVTADRVAGAADADAFLDSLR